MWGVKKKPTKRKPAKKDFSQKALSIVEQITGAKLVKPKRNRKSV
jgi:hypothetical protein